MFDNKIQDADKDPILSLMEDFKACDNPQKIDLTIGIYNDESGHCTLLDSVKEAEALYLTREDTKAYLGLAGDSGFCNSVPTMFYQNLFAAEGKVVETVNTPGGSGAIRIAAELCKKYAPDSSCWVGTPCWANYGHMFGSAGYQLNYYPYLSPETGKANAYLSEHLANTKPGDMIILQGTCHNPTGIDLSLAEWEEVFKVIAKKQLTPMFDNAYIGLANGVSEDSQFLTLACKYFKYFLVATSFSKNFALYRDRVAALSIVSEQQEQALKIKDHVCSIVRSIYSMPPHHGAAAVDLILNSNDLSQKWTAELSAIRTRIKLIRTQLDARLGGILGDKLQFSEGNGLFCLLPVEAELLLKLREEYGIFIVGSGRINVTSLNDSNIDYFCQSLEAVLS